MREFTETVKKTWRVGDWLPGGTWTPSGVTVEGPKSVSLLRHEDEIEQMIPKAPEDVKEYVRLEIVRHRSLAENEVRSSLWAYPYKLRWQAGVRQVLDLSGSTWTPHRDFSCPEAQARAEAWFERNRPLADDEAVSFRNAGRGKMRIKDGRLLVDWYDSTINATWSRGALISLLDHPTLGAEAKRRLAFLDKHAPQPERLPDNQFRDASGLLWTFTMRDDGEADVVCEEKGHTHITECFVTFLADWSRAALAYRDRERARWTFEKTDDIPLIVFVRNGENVWSVGKIGEYPNRPKLPTWVRDRAREMLREESQETYTEKAARAMRDKARLAAARMDLSGVERREGAAWTHVQDALESIEYALEVLR